MSRGPERPSFTTVRRLALASRGVCQFENCPEQLWDASLAVDVGEVAHIQSYREMGPRFEAARSKTFLHSFANLMFLCHRHHRLIDEVDVQSFPAARLRAMKAASESSRSQLEAPAPLDVDQVVANAIARLDVERRSNLWKDYVREELELSRATCAVMFEALGVPPSLATELGTDSSIRSDLTELPPHAFVLMVGDMGSGKSLLLHRLFQSALSEVDEPRMGNYLPIFLRASDVGSGLRHAVLLRKADVEATSRTPTCIFLDGLDEVLPQAAYKLVDELRALAARGSRVVATSRFEHGVRTEQIATVSGLSSQAVTSLVERISGRAVQWLPETIASACSRPLFAILVGVEMSEDASRSYADDWDLLDRTVRAALRTESGPTDREVGKVLRDLSIAILSKGEPPYLSDVAPTSDVQALLRRSRLVVERKHRVEFALPIFARWFAAEAILANELPLSVLGDCAQDAQPWVASFVVALRRMSPERADNVFAAIVHQNPAAAAALLDAEQRHIRHRDTDPLEALPTLALGRALRDATESWVEAFGNYARVASSVCEGTSVRPLGVAKSGGWIRTSWACVTQGLPPVSEMSERDQTGRWSVVRGTTGFRGILQRWSWGLDQIRTDVKAWFEAAPPLGHSLTTEEEEHAWARRLTSGRVFAPVPRSKVVHEIDSLLSGPSHVESITRISGGQHTNYTRSGLLERRASNEEKTRSLNSSIEYPYPVPDLGQEGGWIWSGFSHEGLFSLVTEIHARALQVYRDLVGGFGVGHPCNRSPMATLQDFRLCSVLVPPQKFPGAKPYLQESGPFVEYVLAPTTSGGPVIDFGLAKAGPSGVVEAFQALGVAEGATRQVGSGSYSLDFVFGDCPVGHLVYQWLTSDYRTIGLTDRY